MDQHQPSPDMTIAKAGMSKTSLYVIAGIIIVVIGAAVYLLSPKTPETVDQMGTEATSTQPVIPSPVPTEASAPATSTQPVATTSTVPTPSSTTPTTPTAPKAPVTPPAVIVPPTSRSKYKDGTYTAEGAYAVHAGPEEITITVTLKNDVIVDSQFQAVPNLKMSQRYMDMFSENYKQLVVGKNIADVNLTKVSGSSLTPIGFNDALAKIKAQAVVSQS